MKIPDGPTDMITQLINRKTDDPRDAFREFMTHFPDFSWGPNDAQEALIMLIDKLNLNEFVGECTQTIHYSGGTSVNTYPFSVFLESKDLVLSDYIDSSGNVHPVSIQTNKISKVPKILVVTPLGKSSEENLVALLVWNHGHYFAFVKDPEWFRVDDEDVIQATPNFDMKYYLAFYTT